MRARRSRAPSATSLSTPSTSCSACVFCQPIFKTATERADLLQQPRSHFPFIDRIFADAGYQGLKMAETIAAKERSTLEIVRPCDFHRLVVLPKRWIVERSSGVDQPKSKT